jgi:hypothetical protein
MLIYILSFPFFLGVDNTRYPANNYNSLIYPFRKFS